MPDEGRFEKAKGKGMIICIKEQLLKIKVFIKNDVESFNQRLHPLSVSIMVTVEE